MAPVLELSIPSTTISSDAKPFTLYNVSIRQSLRNCTLQKRYSDFVALHDALTSQCHGPPPVTLPAKSWFRRTVSSPELTEERRKGLESYLRAINEDRDVQWRNSAAWKTFLNLPANISSSSNEAVSAGVSNAPARLTDMRGPVVDPVIWLDVHRELRSQIKNARTAISKRDHSTTAQAQHEASNEAKRHLVRSSTMLSALDEGLSPLSDGGNKGTTNGAMRLGEGELRRRKNLLISAKKERDGLEELLYSYPTKSSKSTEYNDNASEAVEKALLVGAGTGSASKSGKRVLGGASKETERTRELNNAEVLQLQKQIIAEQDADVGDLTKVVQRMKDMGVQIHDELQLQNEMVDILNKDVGRVQDKMQVAKKRIGKIT